MDTRDESNHDAGKVRLTDAALDQIEAYAVALDRWQRAVLYADDLRTLFSPPDGPFSGADLMCLVHEVRLLRAKADNQIKENVSSA